MAERNSPLNQPPCKPTIKQDPSLTPFRGRDNAIAGTSQEHVGVGTECSTDTGLPLTASFTVGCWALIRRLPYALIVRSSRFSSLEGGNTTERLSRNSTLLPGEGTRSSTFRTVSEKGRHGAFDNRLPKGGMIRDGGSVYCASTTTRNPKMLVRVAGASMRRTAERQ